MARTHAMRCAKIARAKCQRSHHYRFSAGGRQPGHGVLPDAAVGRKHDTMRRFGQKGARLAQARLGLGIEVLAFDADAGAEQRQHADTPQKGPRRGDRRVQLEHDAGLESPGRDFLQSRVGVGVLCVDADQIGTGIGELLDLAGEHQIVHHKMDMERLGRGAAGSGDEVGEEQQRWREMAVGDVDMEYISERLDTPDVIGEAAEIRRPQRHFGHQPVPGQPFEPVVGRTIHDSDPFALATADRKADSAARNSAAWRAASVALGVISTSCAPGTVAASVCA